ncbi:MAG: YraN family protein [Ignavibacteriaceae bacterium]|nr:YraN family protein [Ignavibacteriaceae bacterium]
MFLSNKELGKKGEAIAGELLIGKGYEILERNYRYGHGEIDIVAKDPSDGYTVFIEVKARQNLEYGEPEYAITKNKQKQIKKIAELYLFDKEIIEMKCRFDVITVLLQGKGKPIINHYENAFM